MNAAKKALVRTNQFVQDHKVALTVVTTAATTMVVARKTYGRAFDVANQFIAEHGLADEFLEYVPTKIVN